MLEKLCVNCKYHMPILITPSNRPKGKCLISNDINLVTGEKTYYDAAAARMFYDCGSEGKHFTPGKFNAFPILVDEDDIMLITSELFMKFAISILIVKIYNKF